MSETGYDEETGSWADYASVQMFPGCDCGHDATSHSGWHCDWEGCAVPGCGCETEWEHT
jgi:hypothetical protein